MIFPSDIKPFEIYRDSFSRDIFALNMVTFGYRNFQQATIIKRLDDLPRDRADLEVFLRNDDNKPILFNSYIDDFIICTVFENYFKAKLILNGFLVHEFHREEKRWKKEQLKKPIDSSLIEISDDYECSLLTDKTLQFSILLTKESYRKYYGMDNEIINFLMSKNKDRNRLHLLPSLIADLSPATIEYYEKLKSIVCFDFALLNNSIIDKHKLISGSRLVVRKNCT